MNRRDAIRRTAAVGAALALPAWAQAPVNTTDGIPSSSLTAGAASATFFTART